jgi:hypothetical protein
VHTLFFEYPNLLSTPSTQYGMEGVYVNVYVGDSSVLQVWTSAFLYCGHQMCLMYSIAQILHDLMNLVSGT